MKIKLMLAAALAALTLASCVKEEGQTVNNGETQSLTFSISTDGMKAPGVRAIADPVANNTTVTFGDGKLYLVNSAGKIEYVYNFSSTAATDVNDTPTPGNTIKISEVTGGNSITINNIKASVKTAVIVGNTSSINETAFNALGVGSIIADVKAYTIKTEMQYDAINLGLAKATLYGEGTIVDDPSVTPGPGEVNAKKKIEITLKPQVARIELSDISRKTTAVIEEYNVSGIFLNNYYSEARLDGGLTSSTDNGLVNSGQGGTSKYDDNVGVYTTTGTGYRLYDYSATFFGNNTVTTSTKYPNGTNNTKVWAYNILAPKLATEATRIIVKLENVKATAASGLVYIGPKYLTVSKFTDMTGASDVTAFEPGKIYQIDPGVFQFDENNIKDDGETGNIDLAVKVTLIDWTTEKIKPELQ